VQDYRKLKGWEKSHHLTLEVYKVTSLFPKAELYGLPVRFGVLAGLFPPTSGKGAEGTETRN